MKRLILLVFLMAATGVLAQESAGGEVFLDAVSFAADTPDSARVDIYVAIPAAAVTFERKAGIFTGRYQAQIRLEGAGRRWFDSTYIRTVRAPRYEITNGDEPSAEFYQIRLVVPPGAYTASLDIVDLRTNLHSSQSRDVTATAIGTTPFVLSGLLLVRSIREDAGTFVITPMTSESISGDDDGYFLFFEAYNAGAAQDVVLTAEYRGAAKAAAGSVIVRKEIPAGRSQQWVHMPGERIPRGRFTVEITARAATDSAHVLATTSRAIRLEGIGGNVPLADEELDQRIAQLRYVANQNDIDEIRAGATLLDRQRRYAEFWSRLDPTPGTATNEAMADYFARIDYAEAHFRSYAAGWMTDKGRVYVIYGPPDNVSSDPFRADSRGVENWQYFRRNVRITFVDESGFGDFRLVTPIPLGEKYRYGT